MSENDNRQQKSDNLKPAQRRAILALLSTQTVKDAATNANLSESTIHRYLDDPAFIQALRAAESRALDVAVRQLIRLAEKATQTLESILDNPKASPGVRVRAAHVILARLLQLRELLTVEERLTKLENRYNETD